MIESQFFAGSVDEGFTRGHLWSQDTMGNAIYAANVGEAIGVQLRAEYSNHPAYRYVVNQAVRQLVSEEPPMVPSQAANFALAVARATERTGATA